MPTSYTRADEAAQSNLNEMLDLYHSELRDAGVTFDVIFARAARNENGDIDGPAIKHGGYPAAAKVRIVSLKDRAKGNADVEIIIDEDEWETLSDARRNALIDHELEHVELVLEETKDGSEAVVKRDDLGRPKLKMRLHDRHFGWFDVCAQRHGSDSVEALQLARFQLTDQWMDYVPAPVEATTAA